jgi:hypothetical protein
MGASKRIAIALAADVDADALIAASLTRFFRKPPGGPSCLSRAAD